MNLSQFTHAKGRLSSVNLPALQPFLYTIDCPQSSAVSPHETRPQKGHISPNTSCRLKCLFFFFFSYTILIQKIFGPDSQISPGLHAGVTPEISVGLLLLHICTSASTNRTIVSFKFTWLSFILMSQYRVTAISYPPRAWLRFKNPK